MSFPAVSSYNRFIAIGIAIVLFSQCMGVLRNPVNRTMRAVRWKLIIHLATMFSFMTISTALSFGLQPISYINNREFPGADGALSPGPLGYQYSRPINAVPNVLFVLNSWLADGLLVSSTLRN
jgi:hypothetical protein